MEFPENPEKSRRIFKEYSMKKRFGIGLLVALVAIVSFYMGTNLQSLVASPGDGRNFIGAVVKDGKIYAVWENQGVLHSRQVEARD